MLEVTFNQNVNPRTRSLIWESTVDYTEKAEGACLLLLRVTDWFTQC